MILIGDGFYRCIYDCRHHVFFEHFFNSSKQAWHGIDKDSVQNETYISSLKNLRT
jgi:hypothetical protein